MQAASKTMFQLSISIIYNSKCSILNQLIRVIMVRWQSDVVNTKESVLELYIFYPQWKRVYKFYEQKNPNLFTLQNC